MAEYIVMVDEQRKPTDHPNDLPPWLLGLPALEEIIRCRDCGRCSETLKFSDGEAGAGCEVVTFCDKHRCETEPEFFCAWAERDA